MGSSHHLRCIFNPNIVAFTLSQQYKHFPDSRDGVISVGGFSAFTTVAVALLPYYTFVTFSFPAPAFSDKMSPAKALTMKDYENVSVLAFSSQKQFLS